MKFPSLLRVGMLSQQETQSFNAAPMRSAHRCPFWFGGKIEGDPWFACLFHHLHPLSAVGGPPLFSFRARWGTPQAWASLTRPEGLLGGRFAGRPAKEQPPRPVAVTDVSDSFLHQRIANGMNTVAKKRRLNLVQRRVDVGTHRQCVGFLGTYF